MKEFLQKRRKKGTCIKNRINSFEDMKRTEWINLSNQREEEDRQQGRAKDTLGANFVKIFSGKRKINWINHNMEKKKKLKLIASTYLN